MKRNICANRRRLMSIKYHSKDDVERLEVRLGVFGIPYVVFKIYEFENGNSLWEIYIDRGKYSWEQVMHEVNYIHAVKFCFVSGYYIQNGRLHTWVNEQN